MSIKVTMERRKAIYTPTVDKPSLGIVKNIPVMVKVWGCYQVVDEDDVNPYFVVELEDGHCTYALPENIQFVYEEDED